jgi:Na+-driven multidrug efflux pump
MHDRRNPHADAAAPSRAPWGKPVQTLCVRGLLPQTLAHALAFAAQNAGGFAERALLAPDPAATAALGLGWTAFSLLYAFSANVVSVCPLVVARCTGEGDDRGARAATGQALLLAGGGAVLGLALAVAAGAAAAFAVGPARDALLFLATQGLALGPLLGVSALTGYFAGTMRVGPRWLTAVSLTPIAVHVALAWLLTGPLSWSVAGAGLARLGGALAAIAAAVAVARAEFGGLGGAVRRPDWALLWAMVKEGSLLGLQQVVASLMVLLLYLTASRAGAITLAALTLTHAGIYPLLFCFAWGSSQAVGAAAAQAAGRGDARELGRVTWRCLSLSLVLAFALPWGAFAACGGPALAWFAGRGPEGGAVLATSAHLMGLLAVFFVFDFGINFLSALLKAAKEEAYLLTATAATAAGLSLLLALPVRPDGAGPLETFIAAQATWAVLLLLGVASRWPGPAVKSGPAAPGSRYTVGHGCRAAGLTIASLPASPEEMVCQRGAAGCPEVQPAAREALRPPHRAATISLSSLPTPSSRGTAVGCFPLGKADRRRSQNVGLPEAHPPGRRRLTPAPALGMRGADPRP